MAISESDEGSAPVEAIGYRPVSPSGPIVGLALAVVIIVIYFIPQVLGVVYLVAAEGMRGRTVGEVMSSLSESGIGAVVISLVASQVLALLFVILFARRRGRRPGDVLSLRQPKGGLWAYALWPVVFIGIAFAAGYLISLVLPHDPLEDMQAMIPLIFSNWAWLVMIALAIGAPLFEEFLFRGFLFSSIAQSRIGVIGAALITSAAWSAIHPYSLQGMVLLFILGLTLSLMLVRTGSLWVCVLSHGLYNGLVFAVTRLTMSPV